MSIERYLQRQCVLIVCATLLVACQQEQERDLDQLRTGQDLLGSYGCGACHQIPGIVGRPGTLAQPLIGFRHRSFIAGVLPNTESMLAQWIQHPQQAKPGTAMPDLGVSATEAGAMARYLYEH